MPSFPNKQSTLKNQNINKVSIAQDIENIDMGDQDGEIQPDEEHKQETNVGSIFGSIVDFITNKNSPRDDKSPRPGTATKARSQTVNYTGTEGMERIKKLAKDLEKTHKLKHGLSEREDNPGTDIMAKITGMFSNSSKTDREGKEDETPKEDTESTWDPNMTKDEKLFQVDEETKKE